MNHEQGKIKILKFGGSSVGSVERIKHVARLISDEQPKVVVLSAMSGTTDALAGIAAKLSGGDMDGALDELIDALVTADQAEKLQRSEE